jgi:hypothetical protein
MNDPVFDTAFKALTKALQKGNHLSSFSLDEREEIAAALVDAISPELHKDLHRRLDQQTQAVDWIRTIAGGGGPLPSAWSDTWRKRAETAEAAVQRVRGLCDLTINVSVRVDARHQAIDTLAALDQAGEGDHA